MTSVYLDANAIIRFVETDDDLFDSLLDHTRDGEKRLYTSEFTLAEVLVLPLRENNTELLSVYETLFGVDNEIDIIPVDRAILRRSAELRATLGNKAPDAIHIATAALAECSVFISSDLRIHLPDGMRRIDAEAVREMNIWE
ncbi:PIN domain-containing protein [Bosea sp. CCNWLW174]|uniref:type II toxin-antitoxin system VapC family toxin n=1 Tax=unclassified Bosea (in: a-proteobacteria) TaxID=2653178 RepID=UPI0030153C9A